MGYGEANWMRDRANVLASDLFTRDPEMQFVFVLSDDMAKGVYSAASLAGLQPKITGYNGDCETLNSVWNDKITATLYQGWRDIGAQVIRTSLEITQGKEVPAKIVMLTFVIDKAAMQQIQDGTFEGATEGLTADVGAIDGCS